MNFFPQALCGTDGPGNIPSPSGRPGGRRRLHRSFPRPSCGAGSAFTVAPLWGGGGGIHRWKGLLFARRHALLWSPPGRTLCTHLPFRRSAPTAPTVTRGQGSSRTCAAVSFRGCRGRGVEDYPPSLPPSGRPAVPPPRVVRPSFGSPAAPLLSPSRGVAPLSRCRVCPGWFLLVFFVG